MGEKVTVLAVDDEPKILELLKSYLEMNGYTALCAKTGLEGMALFNKHRRTENSVSLILLDLMLPDFSGEDFCKRIREESDVPIIMLTAKVDEPSVLRGLKLGADDYVNKPFSPRQLMARIEAVLRRGSEGQNAHQGQNAHASLLTQGQSPKGQDARQGQSINERFLFHKDLIMDREHKSVRMGNTLVNLTRDEYRLLELLMSKQDRIFSREEILNVIKGSDFGGFDRAIDTHIKKLRVKLKDNPKTPKYIVTVYGMGYKIGVVE